MRRTVEEFQGEIKIPPKLQVLLHPPPEALQPSVGAGQNTGRGPGSLQTIRKTFHLSSIYIYNSTTLFGARYLP